MTDVYAKIAAALRAQDDGAVVVRDGEGRGLTGPELADAIEAGNPIALAFADDVIATAVRMVTLMARASK